MTYANGQAGSIYKQHIPLVNATRKPGEWQSYDIIYTAPRFSENGRMISKIKTALKTQGLEKRINHVRKIILKLGNTAKRIIVFISIKLST